MRTRIREDQVLNQDLLTENEAYGFISSLKNIPNGVVGLDGYGKIPSNVLPSIPLPTTYVVNSQTSMLTLSANVGDIAIRRDVGISYVLVTTPASSIGSWEEILIAQPVQSVNNQVGNVVLSTDVVGEGGSNLYFSSARAKNAAVVNNTSGSQTDQAASVQALKSYVNSSLSVAPSYTFFVAQNGNDSAGTGSVNTPFLTISGALTYVASHISDPGAQVLIAIAPGVYSENITLTRPRTHLVSLVKSLSNNVTISGSITINPSSTVGGLYNSVFTLEGLLIAPNSGDALNITGTHEANIFITNVYLYTDGPGLQRGIYANASSSTKSKLNLTNVLVNTVVGASPGLVLSNLIVATDRLTCYSASSSALVLGSTTFTGSSTWLETASSSAVASVDSTSVLSLGSSFIYNSTSGGDGVSIAAGGQFISAHNTYQVVGSAGYAVRGVAGAAFIYAFNCFVPGTNTKMSSAMGQGAVPMSTSFTSV